MGLTNLYCIIDETTLKIVTSVDAQNLDIFAIANVYSTKANYLAGKKPVYKLNAVERITRTVFLTDNANIFNRLYTILKATKFAGETFVND